ncbi:hypothetical protein L0U88_20600 [Flavihumibacter sp. RY-1]|uniref:Outer membrane protein with beta-barrel domain n=1 Tax=Flavihumibacter fluminis TaxID=2909236 RepID=A0ABS9BNZ9_9BACT|nr:hypothetical protein [Flavihumibacter fluminis]MCF1717055.1 hypothetical protein [Flavihumibacter fluminis]
MRKKIFVVVLIFTNSKLVFSQRLFSTRVQQQQQQQQQKSGSSLSMWVGAVLAYNFDSEGGTENVVGAGKVTLGNVKQFGGDKFNLLVIGNLSKITSALSNEDVTKELTALAQSSQGVSVAVSPTWSINLKNNNFFRFWGTAGGKFNGFSDVGDDKETITLSQFRITGGLEFEGFELIGGGAFNLSTELSYSLFDKTKYNKVFGKEKGSYLGLETTMIIPVGNNFGAMCSYTISEGTSPLFQAGIVVKR